MVTGFGDGAANQHNANMVYLQCTKSIACTPTAIQDLSSFLQQHFYRTHKNIFLSLIFCFCFLAILPNNKGPINFLGYSAK